MKKEIAEIISKILLAIGVFLIYVGYNTAITDLSIAGIIVIIANFIIASIYVSYFHKE